MLRLEEPWPIPTRAESIHQLTPEFTSIGRGCLKEVSCWPGTRRRAKRTGDSRLSWHDQGAHGFEQPPAAPTVATDRAHHARAPKEDLTVADAPLEQNVADELLSDPRIDNEMIAVAAADDGTVTLRGTVGSFRQRREARKAAERVFGVTKVTNDLEVRLLTEHRRHDGELRADVLQALMLDTLVPTTIEASVKDGLVILTGIADWQYQREEAEFIAGNVLGVTGVENDVDLAWPTPSAWDVQYSIKKALERDAKLDANNMASPPPMAP
jgi:osmotically-inducible protein OsmY